MDVRPVDPRDTRWESDSPAYRVSFWRLRGNGYESEEFELRGARDVAEAIAWAEEICGGDRTFTLHALVAAGGEPGLVRLLGVDPTAAPLAAPGAGA